MKLRRPSPALVISGIALFAALAGTAYAATMITSSKQIKNNIILSADIKDGSLQGRDIKNGTITADKLKTASGGGGAATVYHGARKAGPEGQPPNIAARVLSLTVPPGAYAVTASTVMTALPAAQNPLLPERSSPEGRCRLDLAGDATESLQNVVVSSKTAPATLFMQSTRTVATPSEFFLECSAGTSFRLSESSIIATPIGGITLTNTP
ncbi:MAG TPA: hypothetical protein VNA28_05510 [Solirubrobacteraceae bacterium]|nr:hypothetical protein [Solirubrobacteraceae bacterium]